MSQHGAAWRSMAQHGAAWRSMAHCPLTMLTYGSMAGV